MGNRSSLGLTGGVLAAGLMLGGCSAPDEEATRFADVTTTSSASPDVGAEPTGRPQLQPPAPPPEMATDSEAGAVAAVGYYWQLVAYGRATGDVAPLQQLVAPECSYCAAERTQIETLHANGGWAEQDAAAMEVTAVLPPVAEDPNYIVHYRLTIPLVVVSDGDTTRVQGERSYPNFGMAVYWDGENYWIVAGDSDTTS